MYSMSRADTTFADPSKITYSPGMHVVLDLLRAARDAAVESDRDLWEFAVSVGSLKAAGAGETDLRRLSAAGLVEQADELLRPRQRRRSFRKRANLGLTDRTCFVITPAGERAPKAVLLKPRWDGAQRQLWYGERLVKWFRVPANCQETVLSAFEEDGWPDRIDDPLPPAVGLDRGARLHETIRRLNTGQKNPSLLFRRDGTALGATWHVLGMPILLSSRRNPDLVAC
jgi:hypothetical protein